MQHTKKANAFANIIACTLRGSSRHFAKRLCPVENNKQGNIQFRCFFQFLWIATCVLKCISWFLASTKTLNLQTYYTEKGFSVAEAKATGLLCWWLSNAGIISSYPTLIAKKIVSTHCNSTSYLNLSWRSVIGHFSRTHQKLDSCWLEIKLLHNQFCFHWQIIFLVLFCFL